LGQVVRGAGRAVLEPTEPGHGTCSISLSLLATAPLHPIGTVPPATGPGARVCGCSCGRCAWWCLVRICGSAPRPRVGGLDLTTDGLGIQEPGFKSTGGANARATLPATEAMWSPCLLLPLSTPPVWSRPLWTACSLLCRFTLCYIYMHHPAAMWVCAPIS
jgi:hypothetical protein